MVGQRFFDFWGYVWILLLFPDLSITGLVWRIWSFAPRIQPGTMKSTRFFAYNFFLFSGVFQKTFLKYDNASNFFFVRFLAKPHFLCLFFFFSLLFCEHPTNLCFVLVFPNYFTVFSREESFLPVGAWNLAFDIYKK